VPVPGAARLARPAAHAPARPRGPPRPAREMAGQKRHFEGQAASALAYSAAMVCPLLNVSTVF
jgi:hypothetical protein